MVNEKFVYQGFITTLGSYKNARLASSRKMEDNAIGMEFFPYFANL